MAGKPLFGLIYKNTVESNANAFLFVCAGIYLAEFLLVLVAHVCLRRRETADAEDEIIKAARGDED